MRSTKVMFEKTSLVTQDYWHDTKIEDVIDLYFYK